MILKFLDDIEDLAIMIRSLRESDEVRRRCCIEHDFADGLEERAITRKEDSVNDLVLRCAVQRRREERWGMAL